jgi:hypothetical protein
MLLEYTLFFSFLLHLASAPMAHLINPKTLDAFSLSRGYQHQHSCELNG